MKASTRIAISVIWQMTLGLGATVFVLYGLATFEPTYFGAGAFPLAIGLWGRR